MKLPIKYLPNDTGMMVRVFHGQSQTVGILDGFTLGSDGTWINLSEAVTYSEIGTRVLPPRVFPLRSIHLDGVRVMIGNARWHMKRPYRPRKVMHEWEVGLSAQVVTRSADEMCVADIDVGLCVRAKTRLSAERKVIKLLAKLRHGVIE